MTFIKLVGSTLASLALIGLSLWTTSPLMDVVCYVFAVVFVGYSLMEIIHQNTENNKDYYVGIGDFARNIAHLDPEQWNAMGFHFPTLRLRLRQGKLIEMFEDTNATRDQFMHFLRESTREYITAERYWNSAEYPRWAWQEIKTWLENNHYIYEDRVQHNRSWRWRGNAHLHLCTYWLVHEVPDLDETEINFSQFHDEQGVQP